MPAGQDAVARAGTEVDVLSTATVADTYVTFEMDAELALVALVALDQRIPLTSWLAATAVPDAATTSATIATSMAADGLRLLRKRCPMSLSPSVVLDLIPRSRAA